MNLYEDNKTFYKILVLSKIKIGKCQFSSFLYLPSSYHLPASFLNIFVVR